MVQKSELSDLAPDIQSMQKLVMKGGAAGLAAPQVGIMKRIITIRNGDNCVSYINPVITACSENKTVMREGCLSIPFHAGNVSRHEMVSISAWDVDGNAVEEGFSGVPAYAIQHEIDHLDGILFYDLLSPAERASIQRSMKRMRKGKRKK
jgi:peptide deformylase